MCIYIPHISHHVSWRFTILLREIERQLVKGAISPYLISLTQPMHELRDETRDRPPHREFHPLLFPTSPYPRRLQCLTICRYICPYELNVEKNCFSKLQKPKTVFDNFIYLCRVYTPHCVRFSCTRDLRQDSPIQTPCSVNKSLVMICRCLTV